MKPVTWSSQIRASDPLRPGVYYDLQVYTESGLDPLKDLGLRVDDPLLNEQAHSRHQKAISCERRKEPNGVFLGFWAKSKHAGTRRNAVYGSYDRYGRILRRISKENKTGGVVVGGGYNPRVTSCTHADIEYIARFADMTHEQVDNAIRPLLGDAA
ncbi:MAG: hypothetical protein Q9221_007611 [Calogaya cf. arnoldii]